MNVVIPAECREILVNIIKEAAENYMCGEEISVIAIESFGPFDPDWKEKKAILRETDIMASVDYASANHFGMTHWVRLEYRCHCPETSKRYRDRCLADDPTDEWAQTMTLDRRHQTNHWSDYGFNVNTGEFSCWAD